MKKVALLLTGLLAVLMIAGCGGEGSSSSVSATGSNGDGVGVVDPVDQTVDSTDAEITTPKTPYNLSSALGTPPGLPE